MRLLLLCSVLAALLLTLPASALAHDKGTVQHKNKYLRSVVIEGYCRDNVRAWQLRGAATYERVEAGEDPVDAQQALLFRHAAEYARETQ